MGDLREALFDALARWLWFARSFPAVRAAVVAAVFAREPRPTRLSRQLDLLAGAISRAGAAALAADLAATRDLLLRLERRGAAVLLIAGDSHSRLWAQRARRGVRWLLPLHHLATGASARGLANSRSRSGQGEQVIRLAARWRETGAPLLLVFGQVDVEFVATFRRLKSDPPEPYDMAAAQGFAVEVAEAYAAYAATLGRPALAAILPPALSDAAWREGYLNAHIAHEHAAIPLLDLSARLADAEIAPVEVRTAEHRRFNEALRSAADRRGLQVADVWPCLPFHGGAVSPVLLGRAAGRDHHLDAQALRPSVAAALWRLIDEEARRHGAPPQAS